jgi:CubicO group peptidase (beta-lactamase class C family)
LVPGYFDDFGWSFGGAVVTRRVSGSANPGAFGWDGGLGTSLRVDPAEDFAGILMTQRAAFPSSSKIYLDFWTSAYAALE